jgi:signal transduction histidine kinase
MKGPAEPVDDEKRRLFEELERERKMNSAKSLFVNMVSHEMRSPLAVIRGAVDVMERCGSRLSSGDMANYMRSIKKSILQITRTMDSVLVLGRVQNNRLTFNSSKANVVKFCKNIANEVEDISERGRIIVSVSDSFPAELSIDTTLLYHIVANLLNNAVKYSDPSKFVYLRLSYEKQILTMCVKDSGIGIPHSDMENMAKLFHRGSNTAARKGMGIGMFIVSSCVALYDGEMWVDSVENVGTTFRIALPIAKGS